MNHILLPKHLCKWEQEMGYASLLKAGSGVSTNTAQC